MRDALDRAASPDCRFMTGSPEERSNVAPGLVRDPPSSARAVLIIGLVSILLMTPTFIDAGMMSGDTAIHARWQAYFAHVFWHGTFYPRWLVDLNNGFGSPAFFIYPPMEQWLGALFAPVMPGTALAAQRMFAALTLCLVIGGIGTFAWMRAMGVGRSAALFAAIAYLLLPYHAYFNCYQRGALAELVAMGVLPWGLCFAHHMTDRRPLGWLGFAGALAALFYSHAPTALFAVPFHCLYAAALVTRKDRLRAWATIAGSALFGAAIAAVYLGPALTQTKWIDANVLFGGLYQPGNFLLFSSEPWPDRGVQIVVTALFFLHAAILAVLTPVAWRQTGQREGPARFVVIAMIAIFGLMTEPSRIIWQASLPWSRIQFPWRMMSLQTLMLAGLAGIVWDARPRLWWRRAMSVSLACIVLIDIALFVARIWHSDRPPAPPVDQMADFRLDVAEYRLGAIDRLTMIFGDRKVLVTAGRARVGVIAWRPRHVVLVVRADGPAMVAVRQFAYSGWTMRIDAGGDAPAARLPAPDNIVAVQIPTGEHRVDLRLAARPAEYVGRWISIAALLAATGIVAANGVRRIRRSPTSPHRIVRVE
jgi:hypothetical protein